MNKTERKQVFKKVIAYLLVLTVAVTFVPIFGGQAYADTPATYDPDLGTPSNSKSMYDVYSKYFTFNTGLNFMSSGKEMYMEYRIRGGKWKTSGSMGSYMTSYKFSKIKPNKWYQTRVYYGQWRNGVFYKGPYSKLVSFKTGKAKKPPIKSVKVKAVKVKKHRQKVVTFFGWYYTTGNVKYYSYKIKVIVKLKKKPGTKYIYINGKRFKANKKKYTMTLGPYTNYSKPRGKKFYLNIYTANDKTYGGYSPMYKKTKKVK